jgi:hypothetical protein
MSRKLQRLEQEPIRVETDIDTLIAFGGPSGTTLYPRSLSPISTTYAPRASSLARRIPGRGGSPAFSSTDEGVSGFSTIGNLGYYSLKMGYLLCCALQGSIASIRSKARAFTVGRSKTTKAIRHL